MHSRNQRIADLELSGEISYIRQKDFYDPASDISDLTIIGNGGIGSLFTVMCGKLGVNQISLFDDDTVELHNIPNQFFPLNSIGENKTDALKEVVEQFSVTQVNSIPNKVNSNTLLTSPLIISGLDSMEAREEVMEAIENSIEQGQKLERYWDARLAGEIVIIFSIDLTNQDEIDAYKNSTLYSDDDAIELPCTRRAVIDVMTHVGAHLLTSVRKYLHDGTVDYGHLYLDVEHMSMETCSIEEYAEVNGLVRS